MPEFYGIIILAGLVGDPITKKYPKESEEINHLNMKKLIKQIFKKKIQRLIFVSTCSNYGLMENNIKAKENSPLKPLSFYAKSKVNLEKFILSFKKKKFSTTPTILRFATAFGLSPRMRFDLTINEFTRDIFLKKKLLVYDENTWRPYCHIKDFARLIDKVLKTKSSLINYQVFNAGSTQNNFTKKKIVNKILNYKKSKNINYLSKGKDKRNYIVDFSKLNKKLKFFTRYSVNYGIKEILNWLKTNKKFHKKKIRKL